MKTYLNKDFFCNNREKLYNLINPYSLVILFSADSYPRSGNQFFKYRQNSDLYYFSGITQEETIILLFKDSDNNNIIEYSFIIEPDEKILIWNGHKLSKNETKNISGIENIEYLNLFESVFQKLLKQAQNIYYSFSGNIRTGDLKNKSIEQFKNELELKYFDKIKIDLDVFSHKLRLKKENVEIKTMTKACEITGKTFHNILKCVKPNIYEYQIEAEITHSFLRLGAQDFAYLPIVASGIDNCVLHYTTNRKKCNSGELLLLDFGSELDYYASDVSRTIPVSGKFSKRQKEVYCSVLSVLNQIRQKFVVGNSIKDLNIECSKLIEEELLKLGLISINDIKNQDENNPAYKKYYMHGVSHYIGLDTHDVGDRKTPLSSGMVLSCEPGIYIPEEGFGIRLENDILVTDSNPIDLCNNIPIESDEIEYLMNSNN